MIRGTIKNILTSPLYYILLVCLFIGAYTFSARVEITDFFSALGQLASNVIYFTFCVTPAYIVLGTVVYKIQMKDINLFQRLTRRQYVWYQFKTLFGITSILFFSQIVLMIFAVILCGNINYQMSYIDFGEGTQVSNLLFSLVTIVRTFLFLFVCQMLNFVLRMIITKESFASIIMMTVAILPFCIIGISSSNSVLTFMNPVNHLYLFIGNNITLKAIVGDILYYISFSIVAILLLRRQTAKIDLLNKENE